MLFGRGRGNRMKKGKKSKKFEECHLGTKFVFMAKYGAKMIEVYGGGDIRDYDPYKVDVTIALNDVEVPMSNLFVIPSEPKIVYVPIDDMSAPSYPLSFWVDLLDKIVESFPEQDKIRIGIKCTGGHGRTGTVLAIYAWLLKGVDEPIKYVRKRYCENAVETFEQIEYIRDLTGTHEIVDGSKSWSPVVVYTTNDDFDEDWKKWVYFE